MNENKENAEVIEVVTLEDALRAIRVALSSVYSSGVNSRIFIAPL